MTTYVFDFCNIYVPEGKPYQNDEFNIRIEPLKIAEEFEETRRDFDSPFRHGYWKTAKCYIDAEKDRAEELAEWLSFIYSFAQNRDVLWNTYYPYQDGYKFSTRKGTYTFSMDNTNLRLIKMVWSPPDNRGLGEFVDVALKTLDDASEQERSQILRCMSLFMEANADTFWMLKFIFYWIILESNANYNYDLYLQGPGEEIITADEVDEVRQTVLEAFEDEWSDRKLRHIDYVLGQQHIYEASTVTKIKIYLEYLNIGFDLDEVKEIVQLAREVRNPIVHRNDESKLRNNHDIVIDLRKMVFYVLLRLLGVDEDMQNRLITPNIFGPDIE